MKNRQHQYTLAQAIQGYLLAGNARGLSVHTLKDYQNSYNLFCAFLDGDPAFNAITSTQIQEFLASRTTVTNKTRLNYYVSLSALWTWGTREGIVDQHVVRVLIPPKAEDREIIPYSKEEVKAMFGSIERSKTYRRPGKSVSDHSNPQPERTRAILLLLLDTGLRNTELCEIGMNKIDLKRRQVQVMGKGAKQRTVSFSARTAQGLWRYIPLRPEERMRGDPLFPTSPYGRFMDRGQLYHIVVRLAERAGVQDPDVHRFRHTFAIEYLRNKGNPFTLPHLLGHSTMEMTKRYLRIVQMDMDDEVRTASPVMMWGL